MSQRGEYLNLELWWEKEHQRETPGIRGQLARPLVQQRGPGEEHRQPQDKAQEEAQQVRQEEEQEGQEVKEEEEVKSSE